LKINRLFGALAALAVLTALPAIARQDEAKIAWQPKVGSVTKYQMVVDAEGDFGNGPSKIQVTMKVANTIKTVDDKQIIVEGKTSDMKVTLDGNEMPVPNDDATSTNTYSLLGDLLSTKSSNGQENPRIEQMNAFRYPDKAVKVGDSWERTVKGEKGGAVPATAKYTFKGIEKSGKYTCFKVEYTYTETSGDKPSSAKGTVWLDQTTGDLVKGDVDMKDVVFQDGIPPMNAKAKMTRVD
jgi:hypothetical protein